MTKIAQRKGLIATDDCTGLDPSVLDDFVPYGKYMWATNSRGVSERGKKLLGWKPHHKSLMEELPDIVEGEAKTLGLIHGHAAKVTQYLRP